MLGCTCARMHMRGVAVDLIDWHYRGGGSTIPFLPLIIESDYGSDI